jgi:hypothetical protein
MITQCCPICRDTVLSRNLIIEEVLQKNKIITICPDCSSLIEMDDIHHSMCCKGRCLYCPLCKWTGTELNILAHLITHGIPTSFEKTKTLCINCLPYMHIFIIDDISYLLQCKCDNNNSYMTYTVIKNEKNKRQVFLGINGENVKIWVKLIEEKH